MKSNKKINIICSGSYLGYDINTSYKIKSNVNKYVLLLNNYNIHSNYIEIPAYMSFMLDEIIQS